MKLKKGDYILIGICVVIVFITLLMTGAIGKKFEDKELENKKVISILKDYSRFFTLESCMYKYVAYLQSKDTDNLLLLLNDEYIKKNSVTKDNVLDFLGYLDGMNTFKAKKIYYENKNNNVIKYYVYGQVIEEVIDNYTLTGIDKYYIVYMDTKNMTYNIEPYEESLFNEVVYG